MRRRELEALADEVLRETLGSFGYNHTTIVERPDERGEDSFYVDVHFEPKPTEVGEMPILEAAGALRQRLRAVGEERFPYVHYMFADDEVMDDQMDANEA